MANLPPCDVDISVQRPSSRSTERERERPIDRVEQREREHVGERVERKNHKKETKQVSFCFLGLVSLVSRGAREAGGKSGFWNWELGAWTIEDVALSGGHDLGQARPSHTAGCHAPAAAATCRTLHSQKLRHRRCCHSRCRHKPAAWPCYACMPVDLWTPSAASASLSVLSRVLGHPLCTSRELKMRRHQRQRATSVIGTRQSLGRRVVATVNSQQLTSLHIHMYLLQIHTTSIYKYRYNILYITSYIYYSSLAYSLEIRNTISRVSIIEK